MPPTLAPSHRGCHAEQRERQGLLPAAAASSSGEPPIRFRCMFTTTILDVLRNRGWKELSGGDDWDFIWADVGWVKENLDHLRLDDHQRVNHFRNHFELTRKDLLVKNVKRFRRQLEREGQVLEAAKLDFLPISFVVPSEYAMFVEEFRKHPGCAWIMKPIGKAQGKGIFLFNKLSQIAEWRKDSRWRPEAQQAETYIVQKYIENPYLVGGKKFDLRIYAMVTSYSPLTVWLYRSGFARFSNHRFSMDADEISNNYIHLTNVAIQRTAPEYNKGQGCKWALRSLKLYLMTKHGTEAVQTLFNDIKEVILRSLFAVQKVMINDKHCFEIYGYDILIDANLKPWLLEVNASPSLRADTPEDYQLKCAMLNEALDIIDIEGARSGDETTVGAWDIICQGNQIVRNPRMTYGTLLGAFNDATSEIADVPAGKLK